MTKYGLTPTGFVIKPQQQIISELQTSFQAVFGQNINLNPESNFGQIIGIISGQLEQVWQLGEALYASQFPAGAEGTSVDNILALNNLRRLPATPTVTAPDSVTQTNGITLYPLVLKGTAGTLIPAGSVVQTNASPPVQFTINNNVTIAAAVNAIQSLFQSNTPTSGSYSLSIADVLDNTLTTPVIQWNSLPAQTLLTISTTPASSSSFKLVLTRAGSSLTTAAISTNAAFPTAVAIQSAITALSGYSGVTVSGSAGSYTITWGAISNPLTTVTANTTLATITPNDSIQSAINNLFDSTVPNYPYTDVTVTVNASGFNFNFGAGTAVGANPVSGSQPQALMLVVTNSLMMGSNVTNLLVSNSQVGAPAQGIGAATCTADGPNFVAAGSINTIGSPVSGWTSVDNQLDCVTGTNVEDDTQALIRRQNALSENATGPLLAIVEKVRAVTGVTQAIGFQNKNEAALQILTFSATPSSGVYSLVANGFMTSSLAYNASASAVQSAIRALPGLSSTLVTGTYLVGFTVDFNGSLGGQPIPLMSVSSNTTGETLTPTFGRPGKSVEIVVQGGSNSDIANVIFDNIPDGIQSYGSTQVTVFDADGNPDVISFSRPTETLVYIVLSMITDTYNIPGDSGSGVNPNAQFNPASIATIQQDLVTIGNEVPIGGTIIGFGSNGLIGAFNSVPGIIDYTMSFGLSPNPVSDSNITLLPEQAAVFEEFNIAVSFT